MDRVRNDEIRDRLVVAPIEEKLVQHRLRWFGHVQRRPPEAPVHSGIIRRNNDVKRGRGRPNLTWEEAVKRDLRDWNINDLLPSLELITKMIEDVELLEEKAKVAKHESSVAGTGILTKVEELKEMLTHAKEANDMHAGEVFGEKAILTTEVRELQSRLQRLSDERNKYLMIIEEIHQTLDERLIAAQQEIAAAEKEKIEKEAAAQALLGEQEKVMNSIVEESRKLQKEAEENLKLKEFLVERGQIVDTLQGEMAVICEDVSLLKQVVDDRLSLSKLQRSSMSSLSSSVHSSLHKSWSSSVRTTEVVESPDKHTLAEATGPVAKDLDGMESSVEVSDGNDTAGKGVYKRVDSHEDGDSWELC
ncbi:hypothetical protein U9M48_043938 [Paspalum notatum var. saurae]|uniref:Uncharacterized protein n=1 Tax=Paspalum notatum var. saurae TaxID=547442 RepID=A0AAQ3UYI0_PASNO